MELDSVSGQGDSHLPRKTVPQKLLAGTDPLPEAGYRPGKYLTSFALPCLRVVSPRLAKTTYRERLTCQVGIRSLKVLGKLTP